MKEIVGLKSLNPNGVDLAREERLKKYQDFVAEISQMASSSRLRKLKERYKNEEVGEVCKQTLDDITFLLQKVQL
jgi:phosphopantetheinyl transferase